MTNVLAHDENEPICTDCAHALGAIPSPYPVTWWLGTCCLCGEERSTNAIRDWKWPAAASVDATAANLARGGDLAPRPTRTAPEVETAADGASERQQPNLLETAP